MLINYATAVKTGHWACQYTPSRIANIDKRASMGGWLVVMSVAVTLICVYFRVYTLLSIAVSRLQLSGWAQILMLEGSSRRQ